MINCNIEIIDALRTLPIPCHYELRITRQTQVPCTSYYELSNIIETQTDITDVNLIQYQIKVWANNLEDIVNYSAQVDNVLRNIGWQRVGAREIRNIDSTMIQKIFTYEKKLSEVFSN